MRPRARGLAMFIVGAALLGCSDMTGGESALTIAPLYHLKSIDGLAVPFVNQGVFTDSGLVKRLGGDTVLVDLFTHTPGMNGAPGVVVVSLGTWRATQTGNVIALAPLIAFAFDTATVAGDTLTLREHVGTLVHTDVYVAP